MHRPTERTVRPYLREQWVKLSVSERLNILKESAVHVMASERDRRQSDWLVGNRWNIGRVKDLVNISQLRDVQGEFIDQGSQVEC